MDEEKYAEGDIMHNFFLFSLGSSIATRVSVK